MQCFKIVYIFYFVQARIQIDDSISFGFLSFGMGLLSDIDIESEVFRLLGETRYTVWAFYRIAKLQSYSGIKLSYTNLQGERISVEENDFIFIHSSWVSHIGSKIDFAPSSQIGDGVIHLVYVTKASRAKIVEILTGMEHGEVQKQHL
jgi:sphingosine kinase